MPHLPRANLLIGLDDTGHDAVALGQRLLAHLDAKRVGAPLGATRHLLAGGPVVCLVLRASHKVEVSTFVDAVTEFLSSERPSGSLPGIAIAREAAWEDQEAVNRLVGFARRAKTEVLDPTSARDLASGANVYLGIPGGNSQDLAGALAAVGLHISGQDGVFVWLPDIADVPAAVTYRQLTMLVPAVQGAQDATGREPAPEDAIDLSAGVHPVLRGGQSVLLLDPPVTTAAQSGGFGARPKPVTSWKASSPDVVNQQ